MSHDLETLRALHDRVMKRPDQAKVLAYLSEHTRPSEWYSAFKPISEATGLDRANVRRICRYFVRNGLATFSAGLWTDDGMPAGSGYAISRDAALIARAEAS